MGGVLAKWANLLRAILQPLVLVPTLLGIVFVFVAATQTDRLVVATFTVFSSITLAIAGAAGYKHWADATERPAIVTRGRGAIRNLKLLLGQVDQMGKKATQYKERCVPTGEQQPAQFVELCFDEIVSDCRAIEENIVNSIEDWEDLIPGTDIKTQVGIISGLNETIIHLTGERNAIQENLNQATVEMHRLEEEKANSKDEAADLRSKVSELSTTLEKKNNEIATVRAELQERRSSLDRGILSGISGTIVGSGAANYLSPELLNTPNFSSTDLWRVPHNVYRVHPVTPSEHILRVPASAVTCTSCGAHFVPTTKGKQSLCPKCSEKGTAKKEPTGNDRGNERATDPSSLHDGVNSSSESHED